MAFYEIWYTTMEGERLRGSAAIDTLRQARRVVDEIVDSAVADRYKAIEIVKVRQRRDEPARREIVEGIRLRPAVALERAARPTFDQWLRAVDAATIRRLNVSVHDLPDLPFRDAYDDGVSPGAFVRGTVVPASRDEGF